MLHIFNSLKSGHTVGKNVCSHLVLGKMCSNIERCVFRASLYEAHFLFIIGGFYAKEKILAVVTVYFYACVKHFFSNGLQGG